eukprot:TRINITY_DN2218_c0_g1_i3.p1 TRINITY_DN2218_c0_g1~~TRINITY_DN2218_c0_g1_i3.p1  ORF type:complete len:501 (+),score=69.35 TRINITY_DN2218_c0_g1_i3:86-1588(+)
MAYNYATLALCALLSSSLVLFSSGQSASGLVQFDGEEEFPQEAVPTFAGYLNINETAGSKMYYAFYEAIKSERPVETTPIIIWLQGGPGCAGGVGNFYEMGPWLITEDLKMVRNDFSWSTHYGLLFFDSPVGTGFSIVLSDEDIPSDQAGVALHLYIALRQFFEMHPKFKLRPVYIAGESYAGKYIPSLAALLHGVAKSLGGLTVQQPRREAMEMFVSQSKSERLSEIMNMKGNPLELAKGASDCRSLICLPHINLAGLIIGNGLTAPDIQVRMHASVAFSFGLIDSNQKAEIERRASDAVAHVEKEEWVEAYHARADLLNWIQNVSGLPTMMDVRRRRKYHTLWNGTEFLSLFLNRPNVKSALSAQANSTWVACSSHVLKRMSGDKMKSSRDVVNSLLKSNIPILLFQGQYDAQDGVASSEAWMQTLTYPGKPAFDASPREKWFVNGTFVGYQRTSGALTHVVVLDAGHYVSADQPERSQNMIEGWVEQQISKCGKCVR